MTLLFIRQQSNGPERNANLMPRRGFPGEGPPQMEMLPVKRLSYSLRPVWEDATDEKEKNYERRRCEISAPCLPKFVAITLLQHPLDIRGAVENLASQLDVGNPSLVAVILQTPAADLQPLRKLLVRIETLAVQRGFALRKQRLQRLGKTLQRLEVRADPLVMLRNQFIAHFPSV